MDGNSQHVGDCVVEAKIRSGSLDHAERANIQMVVVGGAGKRPMRVGLNIRRRVGLILHGIDRADCPGYLLRDRLAD